MKQTILDSVLPKTIVHSLHIMSPIPKKYYKRAKIPKLISVRNTPQLFPT